MPSPSDHMLKVWLNHAYIGCRPVHPAGRRALKPQSSSSPRRYRVCLTPHVSGLARPVCSGSRSAAGMYHCIKPDPSAVCIESLSPCMYRVSLSPYVSARARPVPGLYRGRSVRARPAGSRSSGESGQRDTTPARRPRPRPPIVAGGAKNNTTPSAVTSAHSGGGGIRRLIRVPGSR